MCVTDFGSFFWLTVIGLLLMGKVVLMLPLLAVVLL